MNWDTIIKYTEGLLTEAQRAEVHAWAEERAENQLLLQHLQKQHDQLRQPVKDDVINEEWLKLMTRVYDNPQTFNKTRKMYRWLAAAATIAIVSVVSWLLVKDKAVRPATYTALKVSAERKKISLPDGSVVFLAPGAQLAVNDAYGAKKRELCLLGEAFFDVKHDKNHPFIVHTGNNGQVNVLGTSFNVYSEKNKPEEVQVATGLVGFVSNGRTWYLKAGEQFKYSVAKHNGVRSAVNTLEATRLMEGILYFKDSNITQIAKVIERYYKVHVSVAPASAGKHARFSGTMKDNGIKGLLDGLSYATGIQYQIKNPNTIILY